MNPTTVSGETGTAKWMTSEATGSDMVTTVNYHWNIPTF